MHIHILSSVGFKINYRNIRNNSVLLNFVEAAIGMNDCVREVVNHHFRILLGSLEHVEVIL